MSGTVKQPKSTDAAEQVRRERPAVAASVSRNFRLVLASVLGLTLLSLLVAVLLDMVAPNNAETAKITDDCLTVLKLGAGAIFGLATGKALR
jgi:hypothetical protein